MPIRYGTREEEAAHCVEWEAWLVEELASVRAVMAGLAPECADARATLPIAFPCAVVYNQGMVTMRLHTDRLIADQLRATGLKQEALARRIGVSQSAISRWLDTNATTHLLSWHVDAVAEQFPHIGRALGEALIAAAGGAYDLAPVSQPTSVTDAGRSGAIASTAPGTTTEEAA